MPYDATPHTYTNLNNFNNNQQPYSNVQQYRQNYPTTLPSYPDRPNYPNRPVYPNYPNYPNYRPNYNVNVINYPANNVYGTGYNALYWANQWYPGWTAVNYRWYNGYWVVYIRSGGVYRTVYIAPDYSWHHFQEGYIY